MAGEQRGDDRFAPAAGFEAMGPEAWTTKVETDLRGGSPDALETRVTPRFAAKPVYFDGPDPAVARPGGEWQVCQEYDDPRMDVAAEAIAADVLRGGDAIWLRAGLDHGTRVLTGGDLELILKGVDLKKTPLYLQGESDGLPLAMTLVALAERQGLPLESLQGCLGLDPLGTLSRGGNLHAGLSGMRQSLAATAKFAVAKLPKMRSVLVCSRPYHDAGATPVQELAWALATGVEYLRWLEQAGIAPTDAAKEFVFALSVTGDLFPQIAKLRALRVLWAKVVAAVGGDAEAQRLQLHVRASHATRSRRDPWVNMLRGTAETFVAAVGGANTVANTPFDAAIGPSDAMAQRVARNTQLVLRDEGHLGRVDDPTAGSWLVERLTEAMVKEAWCLFQDIEALGGMTVALREGKVAGALEVQRKEREQRLAKRQEKVLGVNEFPLREEEPVLREAADLQAVEVELGNPAGDATPEQRHGALLSVAEASFHELDADELAERTLAAARVGVDLYSLRVALRQGRASLHAEPLPVFRPAALWESLRDEADALAKKLGHAPKVLVLTLGPLAEHSARLSWIRNLLAAAGLEAVAVPLGEDGVDDVFAETKTRAVLLCGADARYGDAVDSVRRLRSLGAAMVGIAGKAKESAEDLEGAGASLFFFAGADVFLRLKRLQQAAGMVMS